METKANKNLLIASGKRAEPEKTKIDANFRCILHSYRIMQLWLHESKGKILAFTKSWSDFVRYLGNLSHSKDLLQAHWKVLVDGCNLLNKYLLTNTCCGNSMQICFTPVSYSRIKRIVFLLVTNVFSIKKWENDTMSVWKYLLIHSLKKHLLCSYYMPWLEVQCLVK